MQIVLLPRLVPEVLEIAERCCPEGCRLHVVDPRDGDEALIAALAEADVVMGFVGALPDAAWAAARRLRLVQLLSAGYDAFPLDVARSRRLPVATNGGANAVAVAEHVVMLVLALYRRLIDFVGATRQGAWPSGLQHGLRLHELQGKTVGIVGFGRIGREVARRLRAFDLELLYFDVVRASPAEEAELQSVFAPLDDLLRRADVVTLHLPLTPATRHFLDARRLAMMKPSALLVNAARGGLVDEVALARALAEGRLLGAGLDTLEQEPPPPDHPLLRMPNVVVTPHTAGPTWESWEKRFRNAFANVRRVARGEAPLWVVPELHDLVGPSSP